MPESYEYDLLVDDPIMSDGSANFTGMVSATKASRLDASELAELSNGDIGAYGTVGARPPAKLICKQLSDDFYVDHKGVAYNDYMGLRYVGDKYISQTQKIWVFKGSNPKIFFFVEGKLFMADGPNSKDWGEPKKVKRKVAAGGEETGASEPAAEGESGTSPEEEKEEEPQYEEVELELQKGAISITQLSQIAYFTDNSKLRYYDGVTQEIGEINNFKKISEDGETIEEGIPIPPATCIETHTERLCLAGITDSEHDPATVFFSDYLDGKSWYTTESIQVGSDGDPIVALKSWRNNTLLVFKGSSVWSIICDPLVDSNGNRVSPAFWTVNRISDSYGVVARETVTQVGNDVWFLSKRGVCSVQRAVAAEANEMQALPISVPVQNYIDRINWNAADTSSAIYYKDRFFLSIPLDNSKYPNIVLIYNTITKKWQGYWEGSAMRAMGYARGIFGRLEYLLWRTHDGTAYHFLDDDMDNGFDECEDYYEYYDQIITSKSYTWNAPLNYKRAMNMEVEFYKSTGKADISVKLDGKSEIGIAEALQISTNKKLPLKVPFSLANTSASNFAYNLRELPRFREFQMIIRTYNGRATLRNINVDALVIPR